MVLAWTRGKVLGSKCTLTNLQNGKSCVAVVGDSGPTRKIGELSPVGTELLGLDGNPNHGGTWDHIIRYEIEVDVPAEIDGVKYDLQTAQLPERSSMNVQFAKNRKLTMSKNVLYQD